MISPNTDRISKLGERLTHLQQGIQQGKSAKLDAIDGKLKQIDHFYLERQDQTHSNVSILQDAVLNLQRAL
jgi:hypothetical protein